jgi:hypothetical protein
MPRLLKAWANHFKENNMKTYEIELRRTSFVTLTVEAENQDAAEAEAWRQIQQDYYRDDGDWEVGYVDELMEIKNEQNS